MSKPDCSCAAVALLCLAVAVSPAAGPAQDAAPLRRAFTPGDVQHYRVELTLRSEVDGQRPRQLGQQTFAEPFADAAETSLSWEVTRLVVSVEPDGSAQIEEALHDFSTLLAANSRDGEPSPAQPLIDALLEWTRHIQSPLRYRETPNGQLQGLGDDAGPAFDTGPPVITLWLRRALRPSLTLPARPAREGDHWQAPRAVRLPPWTDAQGTESGEWFAGPLPERSVVKLIQLHTVQQISGTAPADAQTGEGKLPAGKARFHAESLAAVVHSGAPLYGGYGALYSATRSASREISRVVEGVSGLVEAPVFRARLTVQVRISVVE